MKVTEIQKALEVLGLTEYEAKAYVSLVENGTSNAGNVSKFTGIPHSKIYEVLIRLEKRKLVEVQKGRPLFFKAIKPSRAVEGIETDLKNSLQLELDGRKSSLEESYSKKMREVIEARGVLDELDTFYEKNASVEPSEEFIWTIHGKDNLCSQAKEIILSASTGARLMAPRDDFSEFDSAIKTAFSKGVTVQLVVHELTGSVRKLLGITDVFYDKEPLPTNCGMILVDDKRGMFISEDSNIGFKTSSKSVLMVLSQFYTHEVKESAKIKP